MVVLARHMTLEPVRGWRQHRLLFPLHAGRRCAYVKSRESATKRTIFSTRICRSFATNNNPAPWLAVRKYVMIKCGILSHDTLPKPGTELSTVARAEMNCLLSRVAQVDS